MPIVNRIAELADEVSGWRRHLHAHPELAYEEVETAAFVARTLSEVGVDEIHEGLGRTGVVGVLRAGSGGHSIGLRADMDALPDPRGDRPALRLDGRGQNACLRP